MERRVQSAPMFRHGWCVLLLTSCGFAVPNPDAGAPTQAYCGAAQWDRSLLLAEVGSFTDRPRLGETCLRFTRDGADFELVDELPDLAPVRGLCRMKGTLSGSTATVTDGECRYDAGARSGRLFELRGSFTFLEGQSSSISLSGKAEDIGSVRRLVNGGFVERDGFPQLATGTVNVRYEVAFQPRELAPVDAGVPVPACPSTLDGCWRTALTPTIEVNATEPECQALAAQYPPTRTFDFRVAGTRVDPGTGLSLDGAKRVTTCALVADEGTAVTPATFASYEVDYSDGGVPGVRVWVIRDESRGGFPVRCELSFTSSPQPCP